MPNRWASVCASRALTRNLRDFPAAALRVHGLRKETPDAFFANLYDSVPELTLASLANARGNLSKTRMSAADFVEALRNQKLRRLSARIARHLSDL